MAPSANESPLLLRNPVGSRRKGMQWKESAAQALGNWGEGSGNGDDEGDLGVHNHTEGGGNPRGGRHQGHANP